jgi:hypothetical protein
MEVIDDGSTNPKIIISPEEVVAWLKQKVAEAGYPDRSLSLFQSAFRSHDPPQYLYEVPELLVVIGP